MDCKGYFWNVLADTKFEINQIRDTDILLYVNWKKKSLWWCWLVFRTLEVVHLHAVYHSSCHVNFVLVDIDLTNRNILLHGCYKVPSSMDQFSSSMLMSVFAQTSYCVLFVVNGYLERARGFCFRISWTLPWPTTSVWISVQQPTLPQSRRSSRSTRKLVWPSPRHKAIQMGITSYCGLYYRAFIHNICILHRYFVLSSVTLCMCLWMVMLCYQKRNCWFMCCYTMEGL